MASPTMSLSLSSLNDRALYEGSTQVRGRGRMYDPYEKVYGLPGSAQGTTPTSLTPFQASRVGTSPRPLRIPKSC